MVSTGPLVPAGIRKVTVKGQLASRSLKLINNLSSLFMEGNERTPRTPTDALESTVRCRDVEQNLNNVLRCPSKTGFGGFCVPTILFYEHITLIALTHWAGPVVALSRDLKNATEQMDLSLY